MRVAESMSETRTPTLNDEAWVDHLAPIYTANECFESPLRNHSSVAPSNENVALDPSNENPFGGVGQYFLS
jgi:hypothetical protein